MFLAPELLLLRFLPIKPVKLKKKIVCVSETIFFLRSSCAKKNVERDGWITMFCETGRLTMRSKNKTLLSLLLVIAGVGKLTESLVHISHSRRENFPVAFQEDADQALRKRPAHADATISLDDRSCMRVRAFACQGRLGTMRLRGGAAFLSRSTNTWDESLSASSAEDDDDDIMHVAHIKAANQEEEEEEEEEEDGPSSAHSDSQLCSSTSSKEASRGEGHEEMDIPRSVSGGKITAYTSGSGDLGRVLDMLRVAHRIIVVTGGTYTRVQKKRRVNKKGTGKRDDLAT